MNPPIARGNPGIKRFLLAILASPLLGGFAWGALDPPGGWDTLAGRFLHGAVSAPMTLIMVFVRPDKVPSWPFIAVSFRLLLLLARRWPRHWNRGRIATSKS